MSEKKEDNKNILNGMTLTHNDLDYVISYIKERQTAILVMMFTDIVGFTRITEEKGEKYASSLRIYHDKILTETIEKNNAGKVIKYIGDSVMAIFSEPTKAVEVSLQIHEKLKEFNKNMPDMEDINIRIGLHMGQVAIENHIQADIFGRHVNRASRIESMAGPGQVFVSFPVFDSAKGWLMDVEYLGWKNHGEYFLKGIEKPAEIYEVFNKLTTVPVAPKKGKKKRVIPSYLFIILFVLIGAVGSWSLFNYQKKEVYFFDYNYQDVRVLGGEELFIDGNPGDHKRLLLTDLEKGKHILYFDVSSVVRYYSPIEITRGTNLLETRFEYFDLPGVGINTGVLDEEVSEKSKSKELSYYSEDGELIKTTADLYLKIEKKLVGNNAEYNVLWTIDIGGESVSGVEHVVQDITSSDSYRGDWKIVWENSVFSLDLRPVTMSKYIQFDIQGNWK